MRIVIGLRSQLGGRTGKQRGALHRIVWMLFALLVSTGSVFAQSESEAALQERIRKLENENAQLREELEGAKEKATQAPEDSASEFGDLFDGDTAGTDDELLKELMGDFMEFEEEQGEKKVDLDDPKYEFLKLGVDEDYMKFERLRLKDQIFTFIPPLYQPAWLGHAYVLPQGAWRVSTSMSFLQIGGDDFFKNGKHNFVHENHRVRVRTVDLDLFYGLTNELTLRVNIPYKFTVSKGSVHPNGNRFLNFFVEGDANEIGDVSVFLKKKWLDQANHGVNFATAIGIKFPTGRNDKKFDFPVGLFNRNTGALGLVAGTGIFPRFSDSGRMPIGLQPGTGGWGLHMGAFVTRQFTRFPSALHFGTLTTLFEGADGVRPGHQVKFFATYVKPVYQDKLSLELGINGMWKKKDEYSGRFTPPGAIRPVRRPSFQGGTVLFASPSIIFNPTSQIRFHFSASYRLNEPELGPWPDVIYQLGTTVTF